MKNVQPRKLIPANFFEVHAFYNKVVYEKVYIIENVETAKINPRELLPHPKSAKINPREMSENANRENKFPRKLIPAKINVREN